MSVTAPRAEARTRMWVGVGAYLSLSIDVCALAVLDAVVVVDASGDFGFIVSFRHEGIYDCDRAIP